MLSKEQWTKPYTQVGGVHSLSGTTLAELAQHVLSLGYSFRFCALGGSMTPFILDGDVITIAPFDAATCSPGDVVAYIKPNSNRLIVHRVVEISDNRYRIWGDNIHEDDGEVPKSAIIGSITCIERRGRMIRLGTGPERVIIAFMLRRQWLSSLKHIGKTLLSAVSRD